MTVGAPDGSGGPARAGTEACGLEPVGYGDIPGWMADDHQAAFAAFLHSAQRLVTGPPGAKTPSALMKTCQSALEQPARSGATARAFFEALFGPHRVRSGGTGLLTGYYEPVLPGARTASAEFPVPVHGRPADLETIIVEHERATSQLTHGRRTATGVEPYATRYEIEAGALDGQGLELLYLADANEKFFMQVQGSGRVTLSDGRSVRLTYDGKNGYPYTSIGRVLIERGEFTAETMTLEALRGWLRANPERGRALMQMNQSYVFFRELSGSEGGPLGALEIPLTKARSLAIDTAFHALGSPVFVTAPELRHANDDGSPLARLFIAQDVGSAIRGAERGDIYFGSGDEAGRRAGITKHAGSFVVLMARDAA